MKTMCFFSFVAALRLQTLAKGNNNPISEKVKIPFTKTLRTVQPADIGWPIGNGKKLSNSRACCLAQLCLAAA